MRFLLFTLLLLSRSTFAQETLQETMARDMCDCYGIALSRLNNGEQVLMADAMNKVHKKEVSHLSVYSESLMPAQQLEFEQALKTLNNDLNPCIMNLMEKYNSYSDFNVQLFYQTMMGPQTKVNCVELTYALISMSKNQARVTPPPKKKKETPVYNPLPIATANKSPFLLTKAIEVKKNQPNAIQLEGTKEYYRLDFNIILEEEHVAALDIAWQEANFIQDMQVSDPGYIMNIHLTNSGQKKLPQSIRQFQFGKEFLGLILDGKLYKVYQVYGVAEYPKIVFENPGFDQNSLEQLKSKVEAGMNND